MASDVLGPTESSVTYMFAEEKGFDDHLFENHILDLDEPEYENREVFKSLIRKNSRISSPSMMIPIPDETRKPKLKEENIYENVGFIQECLNLQSPPPDIESSINTISNHINNKSNNKLSNIYTTTLSLTIGKPIKVNMVESQEIKQTQSDEVFVNAEGEESDDGSFKSSYAKSLIDSYRKRSTSSSEVSPTGGLSRISSPSPNQEEICVVHPIEKVESQSLQGSGSINPPQNATKYRPSNRKNSVVEQLEKRVASLTDNVLNKDRELDRLRHELFAVKLECNRIKAENRNLKVTHALNQRASPLYLNGDSQPNSLSSLSADSDTWTLQQQVISLNAQLEKAELSRHAYEAATRQLVHFLQTINSSLTTVSSSADVKNESSISFITPHNTSELLNNLENSLMQNRGKPPLFSKMKVAPNLDVSRDGSYVANGACTPSITYNEEKVRSKLQNRRRNSHDGKISPSSSEPTSIVQISHISCQSSANFEPRDPVLRPSCKLKSEEFSELLETKKNRETPQRRFSIPQKIWTSTKDKPQLIRSGSFSNLPLEQKSPPIPRVSRAVSSHCVAANKIEQRNQRDNATMEPSCQSNRLLSARAKEFFSSLKNIFKNEGERNTNNDSSVSSKKKMTLPSIHRSNKVKRDTSLTLPQSPANITLKKRNSLRVHSMIEISPNEHEHCLNNSIFYVPFVSATNYDESFSKEPTNLCGQQVKAIETPQKDISNAEEITTKIESESDEVLLRVNDLEERKQSNMNTNEAELRSGPQELSIALSLLAVKTDENPSGALNPRLITGGGLSTTSGACDNEGSCTSGFGGGKNDLSGIKTQNMLNDNKNTFKHLCTSSCTIYGFKSHDCLDGSVSGYSKINLYNSVSRRINNHRQRNPTSPNTKSTIWKLSRSTYRNPGCRLVFV